jgi:hypothetical protein
MTVLDSRPEKIKETLALFNKENGMIPLIFPKQEVEFRYY